MGKIFLLNPPSNKGKIKKFKLEKANKTRKTKNKKFKKFKSIRFCNPTKKTKVVKKVINKVKKVKSKPKVIDMQLLNGTYVNKGVKHMKKRKSKKVSSVKKSSSHRISVSKVKGGFKVKRKSRLAKRFARKGTLINPMNTKSIINTLKEAGLLTAGMLGSNIVPMYALPEKFRTGNLKPVAQIGTGVVLFIIAKKFLKNEPIAKALLLGSVVGAMKDVADTYIMPKLLPASTSTTTSGLKIPARTMSGLKLPASSQTLTNTGMALSGTRSSRR